MLVTSVGCALRLPLPHAAGRGEHRRPADPRSTRLEVVSTISPGGHDARPASTPTSCSHAPRRLPAGAGRQAGANVRVVGEQFTSTFCSKKPPAAGKEIATRSFYVPEGPLCALSGPDKDMLHELWVPAFRSKIDAVPGIESTLHVTPPASATTRSSAPAVQARPRHDAPDRARDVRPGLRGLAGQKANPPAAGGGGGGGAAAAAEGEQLFADNGCNGATRSATPAAPAPPARTSTRSSRAGTRRSSRPRSSIPTPRMAKGSNLGSCLLTRPDPPGVGIDALVEELPRGDDNPMRQRIMTARPQTRPAPRRLRPFLVGVAFATGLTSSPGSLYSYDDLVDGEAVTIVGLLAAPLFFLVGIGAFDYWFYWAWPAGRRGQGPLLARRVLVEGLLPRPNFGSRKVIGAGTWSRVLLHVRRRPDGDAGTRRTRRRARQSSPATRTTVSSASTPR